MSLRTKRNAGQRLCPCHEDSKPSLSIRESDDGTVLLKCHAGCDTKDIMSKLNLTMRDLFPATPQIAATNGKTTAKKVFAYAMDAAEQLEKSYGKRSGSWKYEDANRQPVGLINRWDRPDGKKILPVSKNGSGWIFGQMPAPHRSIVCRKSYRPLA